MKHLKTVEQYEELLKQVSEAFNASREKGKGIMKLEDKLHQQKVTKSLEKAHRILRLNYFEVQNLINNN